MNFDKLVNKILNEDQIKGGLADNMSIEDIAKKHKVPVEKIEQQIKMGIKIEREHVDNDSKAKEIAKDHLVEDPEYYTKLKKMESESVTVAGAYGPGSGADNVGSMGGRTASLNPAAPGNDWYAQGDARIFKGAGKAKTSSKNKKRNKKRSGELEPLGMFRRNMSPLTPKTPSV